MGKRDWLFGYLINIAETILSKASSALSTEEFFSYPERGPQ